MGTTRVSHSFAFMTTPPRWSGISTLTISVQLAHIWTSDKASIVLLVMGWIFINRASSWTDLKNRNILNERLLRRTALASCYRSMYWHLLHLCIYNIYIMYMYVLLNAMYVVDTDVTELKTRAPIYFFKKRGKEWKGVPVWVLHCRMSCPIKPNTHNIHYTKCLLLVSGMTGISYSARSEKLHYKQGIIRSSRSRWWSWWCRYASCQGWSPWRPPSSSCCQP